MTARDRPQQEDAWLLAEIEDKVAASRRRPEMVYSHFLDPRQRTVVDAFYRKKGVDYRFEGGYPEAERTVLLLNPVETEDLPLLLLRARHAGHVPLSHRDYLGSLLATGVKREMTGDLLVREDGCDLFFLRPLADYLLANWQQAGRVKLVTEVLPLTAVILPPVRRQEKRDTVTSLRLDNLVASAYGLSRSEAAAAVRQGRVFVNGLWAEKGDRPLQPGDKLVLRGQGKRLLQEVGSPNRKGRLPILWEIYL